MPDFVVPFSSDGITASTLFVSSGVTFNSTSAHTGLATFSGGITANNLWVTNGATFASTGVFTGLGTFNGGVTANNLYVTNGATFASTGVFTGLATFNGGITANNLWVTNGATFASTAAFTTGVTASNLYVTNGATFAGQANTQNLKLMTIGGDEGGQIDFGLAVTNTTLSGTVAIDIFQNKLRFFETGGSTRGAYIDLSAASAGVGSNLLSGGGGGAVSSVSGSGNGISVTPTTGSVIVQNTGVHSVNGSTGAVVSIAVTGANTFTGLQTMNAGVTANNLWVTNGVTFAGTSVHTGLGTFNGGITANNLYVSQGTTFANTVSSDTGYRISSSAVNTQTGTTYSLTASDNGKIITMNNGSASTVTIVAGLPVGFNATVIQLGAGNVGFTFASGVTLNSFGSAYNMAGQHGAATVIAYTTNTYNLSGTLTL